MAFDNLTADQLIQSMGTMNRAALQVLIRKMYDELDAVRARVVAHADDLARVDQWGGTIDAQIAGLQAYCDAMNTKIMELDSRVGDLEAVG